jgi:peptide/nickel transport system substrate-binding protein
MKGRHLWLVICLVTVTLLSVACQSTATKAPTTAPTTTAATAKPTTSPPTTTTRPTQAPDVPKYGGQLKMMQSNDLMGFDMAIYPQGFLNNVFAVNDTLVVGDWSKGAAGTGQIDWSLSSQKRIDYTIGELAENFELPSPGTIVFHIRHGVHYSLDPNSEASRLVNGREMTADDVAFSLTRHIQSPLSYLRITQPTAAQSTTAVANDKWTVTLKTALSDLDPVWLILGEREVWPPELIQKYGSLTDWRNQVGNGAFRMTDFVSASSVTFVRNPNYWKTDPVGAGKGNQLPYLDGVQVLIISDVSTQTAALRTGKIDQLVQQDHDSYAELSRSAPQLQYHKYISGPMYIAMRQDKANLPFSDKRVRQALLMATDYRTLIDSFYKGDAEVLQWPLANIKGYDKAYMPLEQMPQEVKDLFTYNPEKAKQLLAAAGYPNGFKASIVTASVPASYADYLSIIKSMWAKVGVDLNIQLKEQAAYMNLTMSRQYDDLLYGFYVQPGPYAQLMPFRGANTFNRSWVKDDTVEAAYQEIVKYNLVDQAKVDELHRNLMPYVLSQAWYIPAPGAYVYTFWQPWLKNYHGEYMIGYKPTEFTKYVWIDQSLKK